MLAAPLRQGEPVTDVRLVGPSLTEGYDGLVAVPVRLPDAGAVSLLQVGDQIDLVATDPEAATARTLAADVPVVALPSRRGPATAPGSPAGWWSSAHRPRWPRTSPPPRWVTSSASRSPASVVDIAPAAPYGAISALLKGIHMTGFKNFVLRGNLIEIAVGLIMALAFATVVATFVAWLTGLLPDSASEIFSNDPNSFGAFLNAVVAFLLLGAIVYFFVVMPYTKAKEKFFPEEEAGVPADVAVLEEIRDLLKAQQGGATTPPTA